MRSRRICIGTVYQDAHLAENGHLRWRKCLSMDWRGRVDWCQPWQFLSERELENAVRRRLRLAGLELARMMIGPAENGYAAVLCEIRRQRNNGETRFQLPTKAGEAWPIST